MKIKLYFVILLIININLFTYGNEVTNSSESASSFQEYLFYNVNITIGFDTNKRVLTIETSIKGKFIDKLIFNEGELEGVGGFSGLYTYKNQQMTNYFLISKHGGYDSRLLMINKKGKILNFPYGENISDGIYLINFQYDETGGNQLLIYDFIKNKSVLDVKEEIYLVNNFGPFYEYTFYANNSNVYVSPNIKKPWHPLTDNKYDNKLTKIDLTKKTISLVEKIDLSKCTLFKTIIPKERLKIINFN